MRGIWWLRTGAEGSAGRLNRNNKAIPASYQEIFAFAISWRRSPGCPGRGGSARQASGSRAANDPGIPRRPPGLQPALWHRGWRQLREGLGKLCSKALDRDSRQNRAPQQSAEGCRPPGAGATSSRSRTNAGGRGWRSDGGCDSPSPFTLCTSFRFSAPPSPHPWKALQGWGMTAK